MRPMSDSDDDFALAAPADPPGCCASVVFLGVSAGAVTAASAAIAVAGVASEGAAISGAGVDAEAPATNPAASLKVDVIAPITAPQSGWLQFLSNLVQNSLAAAGSR